MAACARLARPVGASLPEQGPGEALFAVSALWFFLSSPLQTVVGTDIAELLLRDHRTVWLPGKSPDEANLIDFTNEAVGHTDEEESGEAQLAFLTDTQAAAVAGTLEKDTERFRELLLYGRKKVGPSPRGPRRGLACAGRPRTERSCPCASAVLPLWAAPRARRRGQRPAGSVPLNEGVRSRAEAVPCHVRRVSDRCGPGRGTEPVVTVGASSGSPSEAGAPRGPVGAKHVPGLAGERERRKPHTAGCCGSSWGGAGCREGCPLCCGHRPSACPAQAAGV